MTPRQWFRIENQADDPSIVDIFIIDIIGDWIDELINEYYGMTATVTAKAFVDRLAKLPEAVKTIRVHINSPGGDVFAAVNIANALRDQQTSKSRAVETIVDGLAASAASIVMMAGKTVAIADNAMVMVHNPWSIAIGSAADMRKSADTLDAIRNTIIATYKWHSSLDDVELIALMDADTWMDADEAIANGFATEKVEGLKAAASIDPRGLAKLTVPDKYRARVDALLAKPAEPPKAADAVEIIKACRKGDCSELAEELVAAKATTERVTARIAEVGEQKRQAKARADEISALCATAKLPELAAGYVAGSMSLADIRTHLTTITAKVDHVEIHHHVSPDAGAVRKPVIDVTAVYAARNRLSLKE
jgi:ATP-dependent protease ClpP protease subunit